MTFNDPVFKAFNDFDIDDVPAQADILGACSGDSTTSIMRAPPALPPRPRAALATSVVAHAVVELETQLIELKRQLAK